MALNNNNLPDIKDFQRTVDSLKRQIDQLRFQSSLPGHDESTDVLRSVGELEIDLNRVAGKLATYRASKEIEAQTKAEALEYQKAIEGLRSKLRNIENKIPKVSAPIKKELASNASLWERAHGGEILSEKDFNKFKEEFARELNRQKSGQRAKMPPMLVRAKQSTKNKDGTLGELTNTLILDTVSNQYKSLYDSKNGTYWVRQAMKKMSPQEQRRLLEIVFNADEWQKSGGSFTAVRRNQGYHLQQKGYGDALRRELMGFARQYSDFVASPSGSNRIFGEFKERSLPYWMVGELGGASSGAKEERYAKEVVRKAEERARRQQQEVLRDFREKVALTEKGFASKALTSRTGKPFGRTYLEQQIAIAEGAKSPAMRAAARQNLIAPYRELREELYGTNGGKGGLSSYFVSSIDDIEGDKSQYWTEEGMPRGGKLNPIDSDNPEFQSLIKDISGATSRMLSNMKAAGASDELMEWARQALTGDDDPTDPEQAMHRIARLYHVATLYEQVLGPRLAKFNALVPAAKMEMEQFAERFLTPNQLSEYKASKSFRNYFGKHNMGQGHSRDFLKSLQGHLSEAVGYEDNPELHNLAKQLDAIHTFNDKDIQEFEYQLLGEGKLKYWAKTNAGSKIEAGLAIAPLLMGEGSPIFKSMQEKLPAVAEDIQNMNTDARYQILEQVAAGIKRAAGYTSEDPNVILKQYDKGFKLEPLLQAWQGIFSALPAEFIDSPEAIYNLLRVLSIEGSGEQFASFIGNSNPQTAESAKNFASLYRGNYVGTPNIAQRLFLYTKQEGPDAIAGEKIPVLQSQFEAMDKVYNEMVKENEDAQQAEKDAKKFLEEQKAQREAQKQSQEKAEKAEETITESQEKIAEVKEETAKQAEQTATSVAGKKKPDTAYLSHYDAEGNFIGYSTRQIRHRAPKSEAPISALEHQITGDVQSDILREVQGIHDDTNVLAKGKGQTLGGHILDIASVQEKAKWSQMSADARIYFGEQEVEAEDEKAYEKEAIANGKEYNALLAQRLQYQKKLINYQRQLDVSGDPMHKQALRTVVGYYEGQIGDVSKQITDFNNNPEKHMSAQAKKKLDDTYANKLLEALAEGGAKQKGARNFWDKMVQDIGASFRNMFNFSITARSAHALVRDIQKVIQITKQLDEVMVNIRIVTGANVDTAKDLMRTYNALGKEIGATTAEVAASANEWLNLTKVWVTINPFNCWNTFYRHSYNTMMKKA